MFETRVTPDARWFAKMFWPTEMKMEPPSCRTKNMRLTPVPGRGQNVVKIHGLTHRTRMRWSPTGLFSKRDIP